MPGMKLLHSVLLVTPLCDVTCQSSRHAALRLWQLRRSDFVPRLTYASVEGMFLELVDASPVRRHVSL